MCVHHTNLCGKKGKWCVISRNVDMMIVSSAHSHHHKATLAVKAPYETHYCLFLMIVCTYHQKILVLSYEYCLRNRYDMIRYYCVIFLFRLEISCACSVPRNTLWFFVAVRADMKNVVSWLRWDVRQPFNFICSRVEVKWNMDFFMLALDLKSDF